MQNSSNPDHAQESLAEIAPALDEAINRLGEADRTAIMLRFFEQRSLREVGEALGATENTARMRVNRAVEKLQGLLKKQGVALGVASLGTALAAEAVSAAPAGLAASISGAAVAGAAAGGGTSLTILKIITMTKLKFALGCAIAAALVVAPIVWQAAERAKLRAENETLREQASQFSQLKAENLRLSNLVNQTSNRTALLARSGVPRLPAPRIDGSTASKDSGTPDVATKSSIARFLDGYKFPKLTSEQIESYLKANRRSAESLLAAFRATSDTNLLQEALQKFPNDPQVNFAAVFQPNLSPEEMRRRIDQFRQSAPDNSLANYMSALDYFKTGNMDAAVKELSAANSKAIFADYSSTFIQSAEEAYRASGYTDAESKVISTASHLLPQLSQLKDLNRDIVDLANSYRQAGDVSSAQQALQMDIALGQRFDGQPGEPLVNKLVGLAIENNALIQMDPSAAYGDGQTVQERLDELTRQKENLSSLARQTESLETKMSDQDWVSYKDRWMLFGEAAAMQWLLNKYGTN